MPDPPIPDGYDPRRSKVSDNRMEEFRVGNLTGNLLEVPGIGPAAVKALEQDGIKNTFQLIGHYMKLAETSTGEDGELVIDTYLLNQDFWQLLKSMDIKSHRSAIVKAISDRVASSFSAFHDANIYE